MPARHARRWSHLRDALLNLARAGFQVMLMVMALMTGATGLWHPEGIVSELHPLLPMWGRLVWYAGLFAGALLVLAGIMLPWPLGSRVEKAGLIILVGSCLSYTFMATYLGALQESAMVVLFLVVLLTRIWMIIWEPREIAAALKLLRNGAS